MATIKCARCDGMLVKDVDHSDGGPIEVIKCIICGHRVAQRPINRERRPEVSREQKSEALVGVDGTQADTSGLPPDAGAEPQAAAPKKKSKSKKPVRACADCGQVKTIVGRGLCGSCYKRNSNAGTLDEKYPSSVQGGARVRQPVAEPENLAKKRTTPNQTIVVSTPGSVADWVKNHVYQRGLVQLQFNLDDPRDAALLEKLEQTAETDRRTLPAEIMALLETVVDA